MMKQRIRGQNVGYMNQSFLFPMSQVIGLTLQPQAIIYVGTDFPGPGARDGNRESVKARVEEDSIPNESVKRPRQRM